MSNKRQRLQEPSLVLPSHHPLSLTIQSQVPSLKQTLPVGVLSVHVVSPGIVELLLQTSDPTTGYGLKSWRFRVGGEGLGDAPHLAKMLGSEPRAPLAARFAEPVAMLDVDESGFVGASFWKAAAIVEQHQGHNTHLLHAIAATAVVWLEGTHLATTEQRLLWETACQHTANKVSVVQQYSKQWVVPKLFHGTLLKKWIDPLFLTLLGLNEYSEDGSVSGRSPDPTDLFHTDLFHSVVTEISPGLFTFDLFTPLFCQALVAEVDHYEATPFPKRRPNTMNRLGLIVNEIGLEPLMTALLDKLIAPLCKVLFPKEIATCALDAHHSFVVQYKANVVAPPPPPAAAAAAGGGCNC